jgi:hypothetical protein
MDMPAPAASAPGNKPRADIPYILTEEAITVHGRDRPVLGDGAVRSQMDVVHSTTDSGFARSFLLTG